MADFSPSIPDYALLRPVGRGAYGEVWLARSVTGVHRAVKIVRRASFNEDRPFDREFAGIQRFEPVSLGHDSQVGLLHVGRNDAPGFSTMCRVAFSPDGRIAALNASDREIRLMVVETGEE